MEQTELITENISTLIHEDKLIDLTQISNDVTNQNIEIVQETHSKTNSSMPLFVLDRAGDKKILGKFGHRETKDKLNKVEEDEITPETLAETPVEIPVEECVEKSKKTKPEKRKKNKSSIELACTIDPHLNINSYFDSSKALCKRNKLIDVNKILKVTAPPPDPAKRIISERKQKLLKKRRRRKVAGDDWFNMGAPEMSRTLKNELNLIQMRNSLDPKRFYKSNDRKRFPKYFQMGEVVESAADFYHSRIPKKQRKANMVEEMMADAEMKQYIKKKYGEIAQKGKGGKKNKSKNKNKIVLK